MFDASSIRTHSPLPAQNAPSCFHCGDVCAAGSVERDGRPFCCAGCRTVYELLSERNLCAYYDIDRASPGRTPAVSAHSRRLEYLDDPGIVDQLARRAGGDTRHATFHVPSMHCSSCIWLLERLNVLNPGIISARVHFPRKEVTVTFHADRVSLRAVVALMASIGYEPLISLQSVAERRRASTDRTLYYRIGVAGFAFGNVMLLSFPEYLAGAGGLDPVFGRFFSHLNLALSIPVLLFSAREYFTGALAGLRQKRLTIDVPLSIGIAMLFARSVVDILAGLGPGYLDSFTGLVFFLLIGKIFQKKSYDALSFDRDFRAYFPLSVAVRDGEDETTIPLTRLHVGDRIIVRNQELVPADAVLLRGEALIDYSFVTGEADLTPCSSGDRVYAGGRQSGQAIELEVVREVEQSYLTRLWNDDTFTRPARGRIALFVDRVSAGFTAGVIAVAAAAALYWMFAAPALVTTVVTAVLIVACPCALALASPFALGSVQRVMGNNAFYVRNTESVEILAAVDTIVFDKTGTLTRSAGSGARWHGRALPGAERRALRSLLRHSTHPLSRRVFAAMDDDASAPLADYEEVAGSGIAATVDGLQLRVGSASWTGACAAARDTAAAEAADSGDGASFVHVAVDGAHAGWFIVPHEHRKGLDGLVGRLRPRFRLEVLSGDGPRDEARLRALFGADTPMSFGRSPQDKLDAIAALRAEGRRVLMVGDGLNDAGALRAADAGISVTEDINTFSPACDAILGAERFHHLDRLLAYARDGVRIVRASFALSLLYNAAGLAFAVSGQLSPLVSAILMPVSSVSVVAFTTVATRLAARRRGLA